MKIITLLSLLLLLTSMSSHAGKIYRFTDKGGVSTLSKTLPTYAAQRGYDILDDKSLRLIEHVYTREELIEIQRKQALIDQADKDKQQRIKEVKQRHLEQRSIDRNLLARYPSIAVFTKSRDDDLVYQQSQIDDVRDQIKSNKQKLVGLQRQAAKQEISADEVSQNLRNRLTATQKEIKHKKRYLKRTTKDRNKISTQYELDLERLKLLLEVNSSEVTKN